MVEGSGAGGEPEADSDLRRRAAWLLGMLAIVAVLVVVVMSQLVGTGSDAKKRNGPGALDSAVGAHPTSSSATPTSPGPTRTNAAHTSTPPRSAGNSAVHGIKCPTKKTCVLDGDPGNGIAAINDYRTQHGKDAVVGRVSAKAQKCALNNGDGCSGGWAETEVARPDGPMAVQKILEFGRLTSDMKSFEIGWAYDPKAKLYYFAIIRKG